ncbi:hypothetical protein ABBQ38_008613 [Trebouxia sp. C0009 RCD-2024]
MTEVPRTPKDILKDYFRQTKGTSALADDHEPVVDSVAEALYSKGYSLKMMTDFDKGALSHVIDVIIPGVSHAYGNDTAAPLLDAHIFFFFFFFFCGRAIHYIHETRM